MKNLTNEGIAQELDNLVAYWVEVGEYTSDIPLIHEAARRLRAAAQTNATIQELCLAHLAAAEAEGVEDE